MKLLNKLRVALAATLLALATLSMVDSASAVIYRDYFFTGDFGP
jgi:hypothetical protein